MASSKVPSAQLLRSFRNLTLETPAGIATRSLTTTTRRCDEQVQTERPKEQGPAGPRRRRMAIATSPNLPFDQLPYQCFQEARQIILQDREEKLKRIEVERARIARVEATDGSTFRGGEPFKQKSLASMKKELEHLKILADINDPNVKRRFEDGKGDMNKPIYRFLADRKWKEYRRKIQVQRFTQMKVVPDVIPHCDPLVEVKISFNKKMIPPGDFVDSAISENPPQLFIQSFERAEKLVSIMVVDPDIPNLDTDSFDSQCNFLATNVSITPTSPWIDLSKLSEQQIILPWKTPTAQKGAPYHRLSFVIFQQKDNIPIDREVAYSNAKREPFNSRGFMTRHMLHPIGAALFRTKWDSSMPEVMARAGVQGADMELKPIKVQPLPYKRRNPSNMR